MEQPKLFYVRDEIAAIRYSKQSWYGHPEATEVAHQYMSFQKEFEREHKRQPNEEEWESPLVCWLLLDIGYREIGRAFPPTEKTPRWVWVDSRHKLVEIAPPISMEQLVTLMVEYRLKGGYVDDPTL